ncbi:hypothetical protein AGR2A_Cc70066 [Agrobacterium genomosp. 2 str. CFBP 5494]|uniref:Uncharacterized protein n=1 Tax=Agrobacterium genomosp. 2 str. CFBP 5494 TaxID=1183436 RepID=A0A9W5B2A9_9HYPH|nr:hypothetical protein AGR2A_Cc70066 [Agrobacterium genomosp. 2 str. CFBP 5494]
MAVVLVPEAALYEEGRLPAREHHVWLSGQARVVDTVSVSKGKECLPDGDLRPRIFALDTGHHLAAFLARNDVRHQALLRISSSISW